MTRRAILRFAPPLELPDDDAALRALVVALDDEGDQRDMWRRARAATAAQFLREGEFEEALYEALHAHSSTREAIAEALDLLQ
jgi:hypothetical protein